MRVKVMMVIETEDYGGQEFKNEIDALLTDIDKKARLVQFTMSQENKVVDVFRDLDWKAPGFNKDRFNDWIRLVDAFMWTDRGCSIHDLPDCCLRDWFEDELTPVEAARRTVAEYKGEDCD